MALEKTDEGRRALKERSPLLLPRQTSALIMFNGVKSVKEVLAMVGGLGVTQADVDQMIAHGFLVENAVSAPQSAVVQAPAAVSAPVAAAVAPPAQTVPAASGMTSKQQRYALAWPMATQLTAGLGLRGFRLNLSVESASGYDDLLALFPKIQAAVGADKAAGLERALKG